MPRRRLLFALVLALAGSLPLALAGCHEKSAPLPKSDAPLQVLAGAPMLDGTTFDPGPFAGKLVVVNFWSPG